MAKSSGQSADDAEAKLLPKANRWLVGGDEEVELHGAEAKSAHLGKAVLAHPATVS
ncbi:MAG TPA: hypothetical protein VEC99_17265 [Clostridia bacterium]|nr:hypothetical protein [Clostridia bacterium]